MSRSLNQVFLIGNLTRDPEVRALPSGDEFCRFSLALNYSYKAADGEFAEGVDYIDISVWGSLANIVKSYCHKGKQVMVQGHLRSSSWEQDGQTRSRIEVRANNVLLLGGRSTEGSATPAGRSESGKPAPKAKGAAKGADSPAGEEYEVADIDYDEEVNPEDIPF